MKVEHYRTRKGYDLRWRWRVRDDDGALLVQGLTFHYDRMASRAELSRIVCFLDEVIAERAKAALRGELE